MAFEEEKRNIRMVGHYSFRQVEPEACEICHNAKYGTVLIDGVCLECHDKEIEQAILELVGGCKPHIEQAIRISGNQIDGLDFEATNLAWLQNLSNLVKGSNDGEE